MPVMTEQTIQFALKAAKVEKGDGQPGAFPVSWADGVESGEV
jgi:hypothetical protein